MRRALTPIAAAIVLALAGTTTGCIVDDEPKKPKPGPRNSAKGDCAGAECRVRVVCNGKRSVVLGPAPVAIRTRKSALRNEIVVDFAGSRHDQVLRC